MPGLTLILASRSPRRAQLLREAGFDLVALEPAFRDPAQPGEGEAERVAMELARAKAYSLAGDPRAREHGGAVVLGADTISVGPRGELLGQPESAAEAERMLRGFAAGAHPVVTGACVLNPATGLSECLADTAWVHLGKLGDETLADYLAGGQWRGKAGGYNLYEVERLGWPIRVVGDPTTVVGLPMRKLAPVLRRWLRQTGAAADAPGKRER